MNYVEVAVDAPIGPNKTLTYSVSERFRAVPGQMVWVPLGQRLVQGLIFSLADESKLKTIRSVVSVVDPAPLIGISGLRLARWMSRHYQCSLFESISVMLPPGFRSNMDAYLEPLVHNSPTDSLSKVAQGILEYIKVQGSIKEKTIKKTWGSVADNSVSRLISEGFVKRNWTIPQTRTSPSYRVSIMPKLPVKGVRELAHLTNIGAFKQSALLKDLLLKPRGVPIGEARRKYSASVIDGLLGKDLLIQKWERITSASTTSTIVHDQPLELTLEQKSVVDHIRAKLISDDKTPRTILIHGITGSGKTEVYLRALDDCIRLNRRAIFLVPEISLTPQTMERINMRFPNQVALIHSGMSIKNQLDQWWAIRRGEFKVVIGPRSALFSPMPNLGLVIIDEEHEWTYKEQERQPRYHVREVAVELARMVKICVVMGSATPDIVTYFEALKGKHKLFNLPYRVAASSNVNSTIPRILSLPKVKIADMREELISGNRSIFSRALSAGLKKCILNDEQAILFLNRRGSASVVQCRDCGMVLRCKRCAVTLTYHKIRGLLCHQCNLRYNLATICPGCESPRIKYLGQGTQKVEEEIKKIMPGVSVSRWDSDSVVEAGGHNAIMESFFRGKSQVLVGTQVVSKGLHLPNVSLVGVILADVGLHLPDFRAGERTFQLLCQVSGRAGRGDVPGNVIIQTYNPKNYAVLAGANQDYRAIFETEIEYRRQQGNPPFGRLVHLTYSHFNEDVCKEEAQNLTKQIRKLAIGHRDGEISVIGPAPAHIYRIRGKYRWHIILRGYDIANLVEGLKISKGWSIDVDPVSVL